MSESPRRARSEAEGRRAAWKVERMEQLSDGKVGEHEGKRFCNRTISRFISNWHRLGLYKITSRVYNLHERREFSDAI